MLPGCKRSHVKHCLAAGQGWVACKEADLHGQRLKGARYCKWVCRVAFVVGLIDPLAPGRQCQYRGCCSTMLPPCFHHAASASCQLLAASRFSQQCSIKKSPYPAPLHKPPCSSAPPLRPMVHLSVHCDRIDAMVLASANDPACDFTAVGNEHLWRRVLEVAASGGTCGTMCNVAFKCVAIALAYSHINTGARGMLASAPRSDAPK